MLRLKINLRVRRSVRVKCPRHPRYNPERICQSSARLLLQAPASLAPSRQAFDSVPHCLESLECGLEPGVRRREPD